LAQDWRSFIASVYTAPPPITNTDSTLAPSSVPAPSSARAPSSDSASTTPSGSASSCFAAGLRESTTLTRSSSGRNFDGIDCHVLRPMITAFRLHGSAVDRESCLK
jgi:cell pole-organizing protein PopZ